MIGAEVGYISAFTDRLSEPLQAALPTAVDLVISEVDARAGGSSTSAG